MKDNVAEELEKLGYWQKTYSKPNVFGVGPTKLAKISYKVMKENKIKNILELGCGQGRDGVFFAKKNFVVTATDNSVDAINFVKKYIIDQKISNLQVMIQDLKKEFKFNEKFDCVYSNLALQFFNEKELMSIFRKITLYLNDKGLLIFSTKKPGDKYHKVGEKISENAYKIRGMTRYFFDKEIILNLVNQQFKVSVIDEESHENLDKSISSWWYVIAKKV